MHLILVSVLRVLGQVLLGLVMDLLTGKTLKLLLYKPIAWYTSKYPRNVVEQEVVQEIRKDWNLTEADLVVDKPAETAADNTEKRGENK